MQLQQHPLSAAFPAMDAEDFQALKDSIEQIGVQNPITLFEGMVIDGWHRYKAANELHLECPSVELETHGWLDPREFVIAQNKARRHITKAQLAIATAAVYDWMERGKPDSVQMGTECPLRKTTAEMAKAAGVSERTIKQAKSVQTNAAPEVVEAVKRGDIGLSKAEKIAKLPKEEQAEAITKPLPKPEIEDEVVEETEDYTELDALRDQVLDLQAEVARLKMLVPSEAEEGKAMQEQLLKDLRDAHALIDSLTVSRDRFQAQLAEAVKQCEYLQRKIKKAGI